MKEVAPLRYGVIFKKAFSDVEVFKGVVRDFFGVDLEIDRVETEKAFPEPIGKVDSRFDLFAEDTKNRVIVDIQHVRYSDHYHRFLHYHCVALLEQAANFKRYRPPQTVFTLVVLTSGDRHQHDISVIDFDPKTLQGEPLREITHKVMFICPKYVNENTPQPWREWMQAINDSLDEQVDETRYHLPEILKVFRLIEKDGISPKERADIFQQQRDEDKMREERAEGRKEAAVQTATAMLAEGLEVQLICKITGLSEAEVRAFLKQES